MKREGEEGWGRGERRRRKAKRRGVEEEKVRTGGDVLPSIPLRLSTWEECTTVLERSRGLGEVENLCEEVVGIQVGESGAIARRWRFVEGKVGVLKW